MINGKGFGRGIILRYYPGTYLEGLRKPTKKLNQDSRSPGTRFEPGTYRVRSRSAGDIIKQKHHRLQRNVRKSAEVLIVASELLLEEA
jgi:hypothetical protein